MLAHEALPCHPSINDRGVLAFSLGGLMNDLTVLATARNMQGGYAVQFDAVARGKAAEREIGQYI